MINYFFQREVQKGAEDTNLLSNIILLSCLCFSLKNGIVGNERDRFLNYVPSHCAAESDRMNKESSEGLNVQMQMCEHLPGTLSNCKQGFPKWFWKDGIIMDTA